MISDDQVCLFFSGDAEEPLRLEVESEWNDPEDMDDVGQIGHIMLMAQAVDGDLDEVLSLTDVDGDTASFRLDSLDCFTIPLELLDDDVVEVDFALADDNATETNPTVN